MPEASMYLQELLDEGLVEFEQREGDRRKYYHLSDRGLRIYRAIVEAASERGEKPGFEDWRVEEVLGIALDDGLPMSLRTSYSREFVKMGRDHPSKIVENERARRLLQRIASDPPLRQGYGSEGAGARAEGDPRRPGS